jgi:hypothetical protein
MENCQQRYGNGKAQGNDYHFRLWCVVNRWMDGCLHTHNDDETRQTI